MSTIARLGSFLLLWLAIGACANLQRKADPWNAENTLASAGPVEFLLVEHAEDGEYHVKAGHPQAVDYQSTLRLDFEKSLEVGAAAVDPYWQSLNLWLLELDRVLGEREGYQRSMNRQAQAKDWSAYQGTAAKFNDQIRELKTQAKASIGAVLSSADLELLRRGKLAGIDQGSELLNMAAWTRQQHADLLRIANERSQQGSKNKVRVLAFRRIAKGGQEQLHVENYDNIASGTDSVPSRFSFTLDAKERARLKMEIEQSERAAAVLRSMQGRLENLAQLRKGLLVELRRALDEIKRLSSNPEELASKLPLAIGVLEGLTGYTGDDLEQLKLVIASLKTLEGLPKLQGDWRVLSAEYSALLEVGATSNLTELLLGASGVIQRVLDLKARAKGLIEAAKVQGDAIGQLLANLGVLRLADKTQLEAQLPDSLQRAIQAYCEGIAPFVELVRRVSDSIADASSSDTFFVEYTSSAEAAAAADGISRTPGNLLPGRISLAGVAEVGDEVIVRIELRNELDEVEDAEEYLLAVGQQGLFREIHGRAILARGSQGASSATAWKPNVAALASLHYRERYPNTFGRIMNVLDPAFGIHAASLDQGTENVEFGLGVNLTLFHGLLSIGVGQNLSVDDDERYVFLATDLFQLLGSLGGSN